MAEDRKFDTKIVDGSGVARVTIPKAILEYLGLKIGDDVSVSIVKKEGGVSGDGKGES